MEALGEEVCTSPPATTESLITEEAIVTALREMLPSMNADTATIGAVMAKLALRFGTDKHEIKTKWKPRLRELLPDMLDLFAGAEKVKEKEQEQAQEVEDEDEEEDEEEEADLRPSRKRAATKRPAVSDESEEDGNGSDASEADAVGPHDDDDEDEEDDVAPAKRRRPSSGNSHKRASNPPVKRAKRDKPADPPGLAALKELGRAAGVLNPSLYRLLNAASSTEEAEDIVRDRLQDAGVNFHGTYPSSRDISAAKKRHDKEKELEGIDTKFIITGGRSRRSAPRVSYKEERLSDEDKDGAEEEDDDDYGEASEPESAGSGSDSEATF